MSMFLDPKQSRELIQTSPVIVLTTLNKEEKPNVATFAWVVSLSSEPTMLAMMVGKERYTFENIKTSQEFVVNIPSVDVLKKVYFVGSGSFREMPDKIKKAGFSTKPAQFLKTPKLKECIGWIECKLKETIKEGDHYIVVGKILGGEVKEEFWQERFLVEKAKLLHHIGGRKFLVEGKVKIV